MKALTRYITAAALIMATSGCMDKEMDQYSVSDPRNEADKVYDYLVDYGPLKSYLGANRNPNFLLGFGVDGTAYKDGGMEYIRAAANVDQVTFGNEMKYSYIVDDEGNYDFSTVKQLVTQAEKANHTIIGHTLCWHAQQRPVYLNSLIADKQVDLSELEANAPSYCSVSLGDVSNNPWDKGFSYTPLTEFAIDKHFLEANHTYKLVVTGKASAAMTVPFWPYGFQYNADGTNKKNTWGGNSSYCCYSGFDMGTDEADCSVEFTPTEPIDYLDFKVGKLSGTLYLSKIVVTDVTEGGTVKLNLDLTQNSPFTPSGVTIAVKKLVEAGEKITWTEMITNGDLSGSDVSCFKVVENGPATPVPAVISQLDGFNVIKVQSSANPKDAGGKRAHDEWNSQFFVSVPEDLNAGDGYEFTMKIKADYAATVPSQSHAAPGEYIFYSMLGDLSFTTGWTEFKKTGTITSDQSTDTKKCRTVALNLDVTDNNTIYYFKDISWKKKKVENLTPTIPLTDEQKRDTLALEMRRWVKANMDNTEGKVKIWDVVNEPLSDYPDSYKLKSATNTAADENSFFWQDYLGENYVRYPISYARKYFNGDAKELVLFVNEYGLEGYGNTKCKNLIKRISEWENDTTVIDGIGSQCHVTYHENADEQAQVEEGYVEMLKLLAATGKKIRISEFDMGYVDEFGVTVTNADVTEAQLKQMSTFMTFCLEKYFELIPQDQQFGFTYWAPVDAKDDSGWRKSEPIGLWFLSGNRKPIYGGFCDGLKNATN